MVRSGEVISNSMVPDFFSSAKSRMVSIGMTKSQMKSMTAKNWVTTISLRLSAGIPPMPICARWPNCKHQRLNCIRILRNR